MKVVVSSWIVLSLLAASGSAKAASAEEPPPRKQARRVAMRDTVLLATDVHLPAGEGPFPVVLVRTPYNKAALSGFGKDGAQHGYVVVAQDTRGRFGSEGENLPFDADGWDVHADGWDTVEWLLRQSWCDGRIGTWGGSAVGITQLLLAGTGTDGVVAQHITVGAPSLYHDVVYPGGVFRKALVEDWLSMTKFSPEALERWTRHSVHDAYWRERELNRRYARVNTAAVHIGGWFDIFAQGTLDAFRGYDERGGPRARGRQKLLMGPWTHGVLREKAGDLAFPGAEAPPTSWHDTWRWFDLTLKQGGRDLHAEPAVTYYVMGDIEDPDAPGNEWRTADRWPPTPTERIPFYLRGEGGLATEPPEEPAQVTYVYDPADPAPTVGGPQLTLPAGPKDQRKLESRPDVVVFTTAPLSEPMEVTGRVRLALWAGSDAPDTDYFAKLCDVYPDGRSYNLCEGQVRARFRESFSEEDLLEPGRVYRFDIDLWSTSVVFNRGHRIRLQVTSSSSPGYDPNPNTGDRFRADDRKVTARNTIRLGGEHASHLLLPVVTRDGGGTP